MNTYDGIPISEKRLIVGGSMFVILLLVLAVIVGFYLYTLWTTKDPKEKERLRKLKEKAQNDDASKKQLSKFERQIKRKRKRNRETIIEDVVYFCLAGCIAGAILFLTVIPAWTDYVKKDYVVYTGEITVFANFKRSRIYLEDGTIVWGIGDFDAEDTHGTVIYSRRTKQFLGGSVEN